MHPVDLAEEAVRIVSEGAEPAKLVAAAGGDRRALESARDFLASRLHADPADLQASAGLTLLNRAIAEVPPSDPFDWRVRWAQHRKP
jgi:hypothetical protein